MSMIGNQPGQASQRIVTTFNVATTTATFTPTSGYTLGYLDVYLNGVKLVNGDDYTASNGTTFTLTTSAVAGDVVEAVAYIPRGLSDGYTKAEADAKYVGKDSDTGSAILPSGTTAQRPASPAVGYTRYNSTLGVVESYHGSTKGWIALSNIFQATGGTEVISGGYKYHTFTSSGTLTVQSGSSSVEYLVIAGGGGGGIDGGGGGGAGGVLYGTATLSTGAQTITVGAGGVAATGYNVQPQSGSNSSLGSIATAIGGGGASYCYSSPYNVLTALSGGSGGGGMSSNSGQYSNGGSGTSGQGYAGGNASSTGTWDGAGGGGAGGAGGNQTTNNIGGAGGAATSAYSAWASATGTGVAGAYAGGGGGAAEGGTPGASGGGGATAGVSGGGYSSSATANTGSGAGGSDGISSGGGAGGSGLVIIRYQI